MFDLDKPTLKRRLTTGPVLGACWFSLGNVALIEAAVAAGAEAVVIDMQHGLFDRTTLEAAIAAVPKHVPCLVRVEDDSEPAIARALDAGAEGVIVPLVEAGKQARKAAAASHYPPKGIRSGGGIRPLFSDFGKYYRVAEKAITVGVMVETAEGVESVDKIAAAKNVDFVFIGTGDLALSLGTAPGSKAHADACRAVLTACRKAGTPCGIFTLNAASAAARAADGYAMTIVANDVTAASDYFSAATATFRGQRPKAAPAAARAEAPKAEAPRAVASATPLADLAAGLQSGRIRVIDLTQTLNPATPVIALPPDFAQTPPFSIAEISRYDERGPAWYWNAFACGEHTGTHFDAPIHWVTGRDLADGYTDTLSVQRLIAPACVIDCSAEAAADEKFLLTRAYVEAWEAEHGAIPAGSWALFRTDWSKRSDPKLFLNMQADGPHVPGPDADCVRYLAYERNVTGFGVESVGTDAGQAFAFEPPFPAHALMHGSNKFGLASLCNLDLLPAKGAVIVTAPLKIEKGSGSPLRVLALVER